MSHPTVWHFCIAVIVMLTGQHAFVPLESVYARRATGILVTILGVLAAWAS